MNFLSRSALPDAFSCLVLGLREGISRRLILFSIGLWLSAIVLWGLILFFAWGLIKALAGFITAWALLGIFAVFPQWLPESAQAKLANVSLPIGAEALLGPVFHVVTWIILVLLIIAFVLITARIGLELFLMPLVRSEVERRYPPFPPHPTSGLLTPLKNAVKMGILAAAIGLPCLLIPVVNVVLLFMLFGYLNVRTLVNEALDGLASPQEQRSVIRASRLRMVMLGSLLAGAMSIPLVGFIGPAWIGASTCHLCLRTLLRLREEDAA
jgi:Etoposide-induced protein 2.4 (EI24)